MKNIQIPEPLFIELSRFFLLGDESPNIRENIVKGLNNKLDAISKRADYTTYKTADTADEREQARQAYLDRIGLPKDYRW